MYDLAADCLVILHLLFVLFVGLGGILVLYKPTIAYLHLPAAAWGVWIECSGAVCPLTILEKLLRVRAGTAPYEAGFIDHYLLPVLYPVGLTPDLQSLLGWAVLLLNLGIYSLATARWRRRATADRPPEHDC